MTLTVRLDPALESALERYCAERGATKSLVVQESLAAYLMAGASRGQGLAPAAGQGPPSVAYQALADLGLLGAVVGEGRSATKDVVRKRVAARRSAVMGQRGA